jgi:hypothetical protein
MTATFTGDSFSADGADERPKEGPRKHYKPYPIDWRFLPESLLILKDFGRYHLSNASNAMAVRRGLSRLWLASLGRRTLRSISHAGILFIHVPKAGGTSISQCLYGRNLPHYSASFYRTVFPRDVAGLPSFAVIRHPVERLVSTCAFLHDGGTDVIACDRFDRRRTGDLTSIDSVVDRLYAERADLSVLPRTFQRQSDYILGNDGRVMVDRLFSLDSANGFAPELGRWIGHPTIPRINSTRSSHFAVSEESRSKLGEIYAQDFALYRGIVANGGHLEFGKSGTNPAI